MTEPIEKWREDFESSVIENEYAKRSQPVVELPKPENDDHTDVAFYVTKFFEALADAGIQCRIKGD